MKKKKVLSIECKFKDNNLNIDKIVEDTFFIYFKEEYTKIKEQYE